MIEGVDTNRPFFAPLETDDDAPESSEIQKIKDNGELRRKLAEIENTVAALRSFDGDNTPLSDALIESNDNDEESEFAIG